MYFWALDSNAGMGLLIYIILLETVLGIGCIRDVSMH
jgi:hypothetical protein